MAGVGRSHFVMTLAPPELRAPDAVDVTAERFDFQCRMLERGCEQVQSQIGRLDDVTFRIKAGATTVWVALIGWSFTASSATVCALGSVVVLGFWLLEGMFRAVQTRYIDKSRELSQFLNDRERLDACFARRDLPQGLVYPVGLRDGELRNLGRFLSALVASQVATLYLFLGLANLLAWLALDLLVGA
jgi:hypothetical protein